MAFFDSPENEPLYAYAVLLYTDAFHRLGYDFTYKVYPPKRCGLMANRGNVDGDPGQDPDYNKTYPNLLRVEEPVLVVKESAFAVKPGLRLNGWESLRDIPHRVEYILGAQLEENYLPHYVSPERLSKVTTIQQALRKLLAGRTDIFIQTEDLVMQVLQTSEFQNAGIYRVGVMQELVLYPYLHKKHKALVPQLANVLHQMKQEGVFETYLEQAKQAFSN